MQDKTDETKGRRGFGQWLFALTYPDSDQMPATYKASFEHYKAKLLGSLRGKVVEIGIGKGANFAYYSPEIELTGIEPNVYIHARALATSKKYGVNGTLLAGTAEAIDLPNASVDAVVTTHVLCSVTNVEAALNEIKRVLRPGGRYAFLEHVAAPIGSGKRRAQTTFKPLWRAVTAGCNPDRDLETSIRQAGFADVHIEAFETPMLMVWPNIAGYAVKGG